MSRAAFDPAIGLCSTCQHARVQHSAKGSSFWRCALATSDGDDEVSDGGFLRYPPLPVRACSGHAEQSER